MAKKGSTGTPSSEEWAKHLRPFGKKEAAKSERVNSKEDISKRLLTEGDASGNGVDLFDPDTIDVEKVKASINAPYVNLQVSTLGGNDRAALMLKVSLDPKENWPNGILQNSNYGMFSIQRNGRMEQFSGIMGKRGTVKQFRKTQVNSLDDAIGKLNTYIEQTKRVAESLQENELSMNNTKFINFLESLKGNGNEMLIESVKKGFKVCYENEEDAGDIVYASFNHFELAMPKEAVADCYHQGQCDEDVAFWATKIPRPESITPELLRTELKEYWDENELADDDANWNRIIWLAAAQIQDEKFESDRNEPESIISEENYRHD